MKNLISYYPSDAAWEKILEVSNELNISRSQVIEAAILQIFNLESFKLNTKLIFKDKISQNSKITPS
jgi:hypothetical protein